MRAHPLQPTANGCGVPIARIHADNSAFTAAGVADGQFSVLICDDRADVRRELSEVFQLRSQGAVESVSDGSGLLTVYGARSPIQVLIGVHSASTFGVDALDLLLEHHPGASPVVFGSRSDIDFLARVYARGAAGLLLWGI